jgi:hypothetical protein
MSLVYHNLRIPAQVEFHFMNKQIVKVCFLGKFMIGGTIMALDELVNNVDQIYFSRNSNRTGKKNREQINFLENNDEIINGVPKCFLELLVSINRNRSKN